MCVVFVEVVRNLVEVAKRRNCVEIDCHSASSTTTSTIFHCCDKSAPKSILSWFKKGPTSRKKSMSR